MYKPYEICVGRHYRSVPKLYKPFVILIESTLCNIYLVNKSKIRILKQ